MEQLANEIRLASTDAAVNEILKLAAGGQTAPHTMHFNQNEEFYLNFNTPFDVPSFPIHHDVRKSVPETAYLDPLRRLIKAVSGLLPEAFGQLSYFFDPGETLKPCFYHFYKIGESLYVYLLRIDVLFRARDCEINVKGTNDITPSYRTRHLYLESELLPLDSIIQENERVTAFKILQTISQTWIGETGRGYLVRGVWMDEDITKFFSKLVLPQGKRTYPYYPLFCKYKTMCAFVPKLGIDGRKEMLPQLHRILQFVLPEMEIIQQAIRQGEFSENLPDFVRLKQKIPESWTAPYKNVSIDSYLNDQEMKEYRIDF